MSNSLHPVLVGFVDIRPLAIEDWEQYRLEGEQFLNLAEGAFTKKKTAFTTEILYNLIAMAIEKLVMAALMEIGRLPYNHTMHDLVEALEAWLPQTIRGLEKSVRELDSYQEICDPYACTVKVPTMAEIQSMLALARHLEQRLDASSLEA